MSDTYVLDASAVLALLNDEPGAERVAATISASIISAVNLCEIIGKLIDAGMKAEEAKATVDLINIPVAAFDAESAYTAALLLPETKRYGLSLGDRACLALGILRNSTVVTAERLWTKPKLNVKVEVIRGDRLRQT
jgi:ribonuclease VapC